MKKLFISIIFVLVLSMTGCSCVPETSLSFKNNWNGGNDPSGALVQTATYSVSIDKNFKFENYNYAKSSSLSDELYRFENGVYTQTLSVITKGDASIPEALEGNDIIADIQSYVLRLKTEFSIDAIYSINGDTREFHDTIETDVFFGTVNASYTPLYSSTKAKYSQLFVGESASVRSVSTASTSVYGKNSYTLTTKIDDKEEKTQTINNTYKKYIDNNQLLFVLRNIDVAKSEKSQTVFALPTVSPVYGSAQELAVKYFADSTEKIGEASIPVRCLSFGLNQTNNSGKSQLVYVQNASVEGFNGGTNNSVIVKYVEPLMTYGTFESMGALVYTLTDLS